MNDSYISNNTINIANCMSIEQRNHLVLCKSIVYLEILTRLCLHLGPYSGYS